MRGAGPRARAQAPRGAEQVLPAGAPRAQPWTRTPAWQRRRRRRRAAPATPRATQAARAAAAEARARALGCGCGAEASESESESGPSGPAQTRSHCVASGVVTEQRREATLPPSAASSVDSCWRQLRRAATSLTPRTLRKPISRQLPAPALRSAAVRLRLLPLEGAMTWKDLQKAAAALQDGGPGAATVATMREFLQLVRLRVPAAICLSHAGHASVARGCEPLLRARQRRRR